ncbi:hypothetical protein L9F63_012816, partial [Diploptera punctata]
QLSNAVPDAAPSSHKTECAASGVYAQRHMATCTHTFLRHDTVLQRDEKTFTLQTRRGPVR